MQVTKREIWKEIQKDSFTKLLVETIGSFVEIRVNDKVWKKGKA